MRERRKEEDTGNERAEETRLILPLQDVTFYTWTKSRYRLPVTMAVLELNTSLGMVPVFTAANCTDCISPVDHHIGYFIQSHMGRSYRASVEAEQDIWIAGSGSDEIEDPTCGAAMERRMLMAKWLSDAWADLCTYHSNMIETAFVKTGFKLAKDGSEDDKIELQGWAGTHTYTY